jgi:hypothetical protein
MTELVKIKKLSFNYFNKKILFNINLNIKENEKIYQFSFYISQIVLLLV